MVIKRINKKRKIAQVRRGGASGFTLMEVLLVLLILSFGLLGLAALQNLALKDNYNALLRSRAVQYGEDILDRIRANRGNLVNYAVVLGAAVPATGGIAQTDLQAWRAGLAQSLPGGDGSIAVDANGVVTVVVQWQEAVRGEGGESDDTAWFVSNGNIRRQIRIITRP